MSSTRFGEVVLAWSLDARIPVEMVATPQALLAALAKDPKAAVLMAEPALPLAGAVAVESFAAAPAHAAACTCCGGRPPAATALDRLFQARVRGRCPWFGRVLALAATEEARAAVAAALHGDVVTAARFRAA